MNEQIRGSLSVTRNATIGGRTQIRGNVAVTGDMTVSGWMDAPNIKTPCKGLYADLESLLQACPHPHEGWWALVGDGIPAQIYRASDHRWVDTGTTGGDTVVDLAHYDGRLDDIDSRVGDISEAIDNIPAPIEAVESDLGELILADADGTPMLTVTDDGHIRTASFDSADIDTDHPIEAVDTTLGDLVIADADGTPMLTVTDEGHIKTRGFNSASLPTATVMGYVVRAAQRVGNLAGKRLSIIGDSISAYPGAVAQGYIGGTGGDLTGASDLWWCLLASDLGLTVLRNCSQSGTTVTGDSASTSDHTAGCSTKRVNDLADGSVTPDIVIILMGVNDWMRDVPLGECADYAEIPADGNVTDFSKAYALMVSKVMTAYPNAVVYCMTPMEVGPYVRNGVPVSRLNQSGVSVHQFGRRITEIASMMGARVIDTHSCGITYANHQEYTFDHLHPNRAGYRRMYACAINALINTY